MFGLIMIGGRGTRFWPLSKIAHPKQLIDFNGQGEMIKVTVDRLKKLVSDEQFYIVTSKNIVKPVKDILPEIKNIIGEPYGKNTAPCIAMIAGLLYKDNPNKVMGIFPGDHFIENQKEFERILVESEKIAAEEDVLVTIGIKPDYAHTGYGYIEYNKKQKKGDFFCVEKFYEKPDKLTAQKFLEQGNFLWNAGIFVWKIKTIVEEFKKFQPIMYESILRISQTKPENMVKVIEEEYDKMTKISIDYAIMEFSDKIVTIPADMGWKDIGSWSSLFEVNKIDENNNVFLTKEKVCINSKNNLAFSTKKLIALVDVNDLIVVEDEDCLLVCNKNSDQKVKEVVEILETKNLLKYL
jgi:mannose-1-phosphate guanylyltransferase